MAKGQWKRQQAVSAIGAPMGGDDQYSFYSMGGEQAAARRVQGLGNDKRGRRSKIYILATANIIYILGRLAPSSPASNGFMR